MYFINRVNINSRYWIYKVEFVSVSFLYLIHLVNVLEIKKFALESLSLHLCSRKYMHIFHYLFMSNIALFMA